MVIVMLNFRSILVTRDSNVPGPGSNPQELVGNCTNILVPKAPTGIGIDPPNQNQKKSLIFEMSQKSITSE